MASGRGVLKSFAECGGSLFPRKSQGANTSRAHFVRLSRRVVAPHAHSGLPAACASDSRALVANSRVAQGRLMSSDKQRSGTEDPTATHFGFQNVRADEKAKLVSYRSLNMHRTSFQDDTLSQRLHTCMRAHTYTRTVTLIHTRAQIERRNFGGAFVSFPNLQLVTMQVEQVFSTVASKYDIMNDFMSGGMCFHLLTLLL